MKKLLITQSIILFSGTLFAWYNVIRNFVRFYHVEGTIFKIHNCLIPNPVTEACFYGAVAFLVALIWSLVIAQKAKDKIVRQQRCLWWFLVFGTIFAWFNVAREFIAFYSVSSGPVLGCSATPIVNPFYTPCFTGATIFLLVAFLAGSIYVSLHKDS